MSHVFSQSDRVMEGWCCVYADSAVNGFGNLYATREQARRAAHRMSKLVAIIHVIPKSPRTPKIEGGAL